MSVWGVKTIDSAPPLQQQQTEDSAQAPRSLLASAAPQEEGLDANVLRQHHDDESSGLASSSTTSTEDPMWTEENRSVMQTATAFVGWWRLPRRRRRRSTHHQGDGDSSSDNNDPSSSRQRNPWLALLFGQAIALTASSMNAASYTLVDRYAVQTQLFQLFWVYILLSGHLFLRSTTTTIAASDRADPSGHQVQVVPQTEEEDGPSEESVDIEENDGEGEEYYYVPFLPSFLSRRLPLRIPWWIYLSMSLLDVVPNFLTLFSYGYTSLTSTTLLGSLTVPSTMLFTRLLLSKIFRPHHYAGVVLCVLGGTLTIYMDSTGSESSSSSFKSSPACSVSLLHRRHTSSCCCIDVRTWGCCRRVYSEKSGSV